MALKLPSFCFDVESGESSHHHNVHKEQYFASPTSAHHGKSFNIFFFLLEKLLTGTIHMVNDYTKCLDCPETVHI